MKTQSFTTQIIEADADHYLTQADEAIALKDRIVATRIALGKFDSADNYVEISKEAGDLIKKQQEELAAAEVAEAAEG